MKIIGDGGHAEVIRMLMRDSMILGDGTVIAVGDNLARKREAEAHAGESFPILKHRLSHTMWIESIGEGTVVMAGVIVQPGAVIGRFCILNTGCTIDHHCIIEDYAHIAPGAHLCGGVHVGEGALVGVGVGLEPGCIVPPWHIVKREEYTVCPMK